MRRSSLVRFWSAALLTLALLALLPGEARPDPRRWGAEARPVRQGYHIEWQRGSFRNPTNGKTVVVWSDTRMGTRDVYGQLIEPNGTQSWGPGGHEIVGYDARQEDPDVVLVNGGWVVAWVDFRNDTAGDVWAQKIDDNGNPLWGPSGVLVDELMNTVVTELSVRVVHDGSGGAIVAWEDLRGADAGDIYAQRVTSTGQRAWTAPLAVAAVSGGQTGITADGDGLGNMVVAWNDSRGTDENIYVAKVTPAGQVPWGANGMAVCLAPGRQEKVKICGDGAGGCYLVWEDARQGISKNLYAQHVNSSGQIQWAADGLLLCGADQDQLEPRISISMSGGSSDGCITVWKDARANPAFYEVYGQKLSPTGVAQWTADGVKIAGGGGFTCEGPRLTSDGQGGLVCAWEDTRNTEGVWDECDLWANRILANGTRAWLDTIGVEISAGPGQQYQPLLRLDDGDGVLVVFADTRKGSQILRFQNLRLTDGAPTLDPEASQIVYGLDKNAVQPRTVPMSCGRVGIVWQDNRYVWGGTGLFYQIVDTAGNFEKEINGDTLAPDNEGHARYNQLNPNVCTDGENGFFVVWEDTRTSINYARLTRVAENGEIACSRAGELISEEGNGQINVYCAPDGAGGCFVAWSGYSVSFRLDAYIMRMDRNCQPVWPAPIQLCNTSSDDFVNGLVWTGDGCCVVVWKSGPSLQSNVTAAKVCGDGTVVWNQDICDAPNQQTDAVVLPDEQGGAFFAWADKRTPVLDLDVYAQHVDAQGNPLWGTNGMIVRSDSLNQNKPQIALTGDGGLYVVWNDYRAVNTDLRGQKISANGTLLWPAAGKPICVYAGEQTQQALIPEWHGGLYVAWKDERGYFSDIYGVHLNASGNVADPFWAADSGSPICDAYHYQTYPAFAHDCEGAAICAWQDERASGKEPLKNVWANWINDRSVPPNRIDEDGPLPESYSLEQNFPNPFNPVTQIVFSIPRTERVELLVFNELGQRVTTLVDAVLLAGKYETFFDARRFASGTYFYRLRAGDFVDVKKMTLLK